MAAVEAVLSVQITDSVGISATVEVFVSIDDTKTLAQILSDVLSLVSIVESITQGNVTAYWIKPKVELDPSGPATGDIEKGALFNYNNASDPYASAVLIPDLNPAILTSTGQIDLTNTDVGALNTWMTTAHTALTAQSKGVRPLTTVRDALVSFRKHRKAQSRRSRVTP